MMPSNLVIFQLSLFVLVMTTAVVPESTEPAPSYKEQHDPAVVVAASKYPHHADGFRASSKHAALADDDSDSEEDELELLPVYYYEASQQDMSNKRSGDSTGRGAGGENGDNRHWAIPYRFGKRAAMPYRFGKRAAMPYRFGKRAGMHFRLGKKSTSL